MYGIRPGHRLRGEAWVYRPGETATRASLVPSSAAVFGEGLPGDLGLHR